MDAQKVYSMSFSQVYPLLVNKAERKGRTQDEVDQIIYWLTGYTNQTLRKAIDEGWSYQVFFENAPHLNHNRNLIKGVICGVRVETISDPLMQNIRYLDKLIDELAKGKPLSKILRSA